MPKDQNKDVIIGVRVEPARAAQFLNAAKAAGKHVSQWVRDTCIAALATPMVALYPEAGVEPVQSGQPEQYEGAPIVDQAKRAAEIAASIPGLRVGIEKKSEEEDW